MKNSVNRFLPLAVLLASIAPAMASMMNVTNNSLVSVGNSDGLLFYISDPSYSRQSYPGEIEIALGSMPLGGPVSSIPGTSGVYMTGELFSGTIESADGSISIPLIDPNAARLGLPAGDLLLTPAWYFGGAYSGPIDVLSAFADLNQHQAAELFGSGEAVIDLRNIGKGVTFGYSGTPITNDFAASLISGHGTRSEGARVIQVLSSAHIQTPEPGTLGFLLVGLAVIGGRLAKR